jgi:antitoxin component of MazEF toxin-antitoxin module
MTAPAGQSPATRAPPPVGGELHHQQGRRSVNTHRNEQVLQRHKAAQEAEEREERYKATRPKVER